MSSTVSIVSIDLLPTNQPDGTTLVGLIITSGISSFYKVTGANLDRIVSVKWYPLNPASVLQESRNLILYPDNTQGTFMVRVLDNYLDNSDRKGYISFRIDDGTTLQFPVKTFGPVSGLPLWQAPQAGIFTG